MLARLLTHQTPETPPALRISAKRCVPAGYAFDCTLITPLFLDLGNKDLAAQRQNPFHVQN